MSPKIKKAYFCQNCGYNSAKWLGKCPSCNEWNTFVEEIIHKEGKAPDWKDSTSTQISSKPKKISEIDAKVEMRLPTPDFEFNRVLGGGIVPGSLVLLGGEPGIGKSTLMLQLALQLKNVKVLYVSGEESERQIKMRAERLSDDQSSCFILTETSTQNIFKQIQELQPDILIVDSIQTLTSSFVESTAGSVSQVRECTAELMKYAKESGTPVFIIGHVTKDGSIAGPKVLEHMVDTVLYFEGDRHLAYRILRTTKNRFGSTSELGLYEMNNAGLREVKNPSEILLSQHEDHINGVAIGATIEGNRPLLIEVQSLVSPATYGTPQRSSTGFDNKRLNMLLAVLEKRGGFKLSAQDVFVNIAGGLKIEDPALDLAVCASIVSSYIDVPVENGTSFAGEVGLGGEIRGVNRIEQRIGEAEKLGFKQIAISGNNLKGINSELFKINIASYTRFEQLFKSIFKK